MRFRKPSVALVEERAERQRLEAALAELRRRLDRVSGALRSVHDRVVVCDQTGAVVFTNVPRGTTAEGPSDVLLDQAVREALTAGLRGHAPSHAVELYGPPRRVVRVSAERIVEHGEVLGAVAVVEDVSELRRVEAIRRDFVSNISHELRTPVGALAVLAETMAAETSTAVLRRLAQRMEVESQRLARMIDDLLSLAQIEAEGAPAYEPIPVTRVVAEACERAQAASEQRRIALNVEPIPGSTYVLADRRQLVSAVYNLLDNAIKYSDPDSAVTVRVTRRDDRWPPLGGVDIQVIDSGIGIPMGDRERIFERFYRVDKARARDTGGTGLVLAIVRHAVHNHGGEVSVQSLEGEGATFTVSLPVVSPLGSVAATTGVPVAENGVGRGGD